MAVGVRGAGESETRDGVGADALPLLHRPFRPTLPRRPRRRRLQRYSRSPALIEAHTFSAKFPSLCASVLLPTSSTTPPYLTALLAGSSTDESAGGARTAAGADDVKGEQGELPSPATNPYLKEPTLMPTDKLSPDESDDQFLLPSDHE